jgi:hypothetical protein
MSTASIITVNHTFRKNGSKEEASRKIAECHYMREQMSTR